MQKLTQKAREYCLQAVENLYSREELISMLENIGVACYDDEETTDFIASVVDSIEADDIDFDWGIAVAKSLPHHVYMIWLDIEEVFE